MESTSEFPLSTSAISVVRQHRSALTDILQTKFACVPTFKGVDLGLDDSPVIQGEKKFSAVVSRGVKVSVWKGDLTNFHGDAVVNAANTHLQHGGGLAYALCKAGGPQIKKESDDHIHRYGPLKTGEAIITGSGRLGCKKIIHAVGPQLPQNASTHELRQAHELLQKAIFSILEKVKEQHLRSVAIPAVSSGIFNFPLPQCADVIVTSVKNYYERSGAGHLPKEVFLVNHDNPSVQEMARACRQILTPPSTLVPTRSPVTSGIGAASVVEVGNVRLTLNRGKIENQQVDVIVSSLSPDKSMMNGQIGRALYDQAGHWIQQELYDTTQQGPVIRTKPYKLLCKEVFHTLFHGRGSNKAETLHSLVLECLRMMVRSQYKSIAFPAIGTGALNYSQEEVAQFMSKAVDDFAWTAPRHLEVNFVILPGDDDTFKAFEKQMRSLQRKASLPGLTTAILSEESFHDHRAPTPAISLTCSSMEAMNEAKRWLTDLFSSTGKVTICNNFLLHLGKQDYQSLSALTERGVLITEYFERGRAKMTVDGGLIDGVLAVMEVESLLCKAQREFVNEQENIMRGMLEKNVSYQRNVVDKRSPNFFETSCFFKEEGLEVLKMEQVENAALQALFEYKKQQLNCLLTRKMWQVIPAEFCEMLCRIGVHAEYAPPDDPAYGEGIYFAGTVTKAKQVWLEKTNNEYKYFVEAEVLMGQSAPGKRGFILPPPVGTDPNVLYDSLSGGPDVLVIFSGSQALPRHIVTCRRLQNTYR
ncbi:protein mono-ADP-ribosyltransferase PARP9 isoform 1-T3 [Aulostomus maculatus]